MSVASVMPTERPAVDPLFGAKFRLLQADCAVHRARAALAMAELEVKLAQWHVEEAERATAAKKEATA